MVFITLCIFWIFLGCEKAVSCIYSLWVEPPHPTSTDSVQLCASGWLPNTCWSIDHYESSRADSIFLLHVYAHASGSFCLHIIIDYHHTDSVGTLAPNTYMFRAVVHPEWLLPDLPHSTQIEFTVEPAYVEQVEDNRQVPSRFFLHSNVPNPFNAITEIKYALPKACDVELTVYNILGQRVASLVDGKQKAGYKTVRWDASSFSSGIYFYRLQAGSFVEAKRMLLLK